MTQNLVEFIESVQNSKETGTFSMEPKDSKKPYYYYDGGDLTKSYVEFVTDLFSGKYGELNKKTIEAFGQTLKTSVDKFKQSYQEKKSSIKEVAPSIFIHTAMDSNTMKLKLMFVAESVGYFPKFPEEQK